MNNSRSRRLFLTCVLIAFLTPCTGYIPLCFYLCIIIDHFTLGRVDTTLYVLGALSLLSVIIAIIYIDRLGRLRMLKMGAIGMIITNIVVGFAVIYEERILAFISINMYLL
jgi:hypothetical protein